MGLVYLLVVISYYRLRYTFLFFCLYFRYTFSFHFFYFATSLHISFHFSTFSLHIFFTFSLFSIPRPEFPFENSPFSSLVPPPPTKEKKDRVKLAVHI